MGKKVSANVLAVDGLPIDEWRKQRRATERAANEIMRDLFGEFWGDGNGKDAEHDSICNVIDRAVAAAVEAERREAIEFVRRWCDAAAEARDAKETDVARGLHSMADGLLAGLESRARGAKEGT